MASTAVAFKCQRRRVLYTATLPGSQQHISMILFEWLEEKKKYGRDLQETSTTSLASIDPSLDYSRSNTRTKTVVANIALATFSASGAIIGHNLRRDRGRSMWSVECRQFDPKKGQTRPHRLGEPWFILMAIGHSLTPLFHSINAGDPLPAIIFFTCQFSSGKPLGFQSLVHISYSLFGPPIWPIMQDHSDLRLIWDVNRYKSCLQFQMP